MTYSTMIINAQMTVSKDARIRDCHFLACSIGCDFDVTVKSSKDLVAIVNANDAFSPEFLTVFDQCKFEHCTIDTTKSATG